MNYAKPKLRLGLLRSKYLIFFIIVLAVLLRSYKITNPYTELFGWRESSTAMMAANLYEGNTTLLYPMVNYGGPGPNYQGREFQTVTYVTSKLYSVFGINNWVGRAVCILFGIMGLLSIYGLVKEVWDRERAILAAFILAILPGSVYLDRCFVPDPAMLGLFSLSLYLSVLYFKKKNVIYFVLAALAGCLGVLTKLNGAILIIPVLYIFISSWKKGMLNRKELLILSTGFLLVAGIVSSYYLWARHISLTYPPYHFAGSDKFFSIDKLALWIEKKYFLDHLYFNLLNRIWTGPILLLFFMGLVSPVSAKTPFRYIFHYWVLALLAQYVIEAEHLASDPNNLVLYIPPAAVFSSNALYKIAMLYRNKYGSRIAKLTFGLCMIVVVCTAFIHLKGLFNDYYLNHYIIGNKLKELAPEKDLAISLDQRPVTLYYSGLNGWVFPPFQKPSYEWFVWHNEYDPKYAGIDIRLLKELQKKGAKWLVIPEGNSYSEYSDMQVLKGRTPKIYDYLNEYCHLVYRDKSGAIYKLKEVASGPDISSE